MKVINLLNAVEHRRMVESFKNAGWHLSGDAPQVDGQAGGPTIYIVDVETGYTYVVATVKDGIERLLAGSRPPEMNFEFACDALGSLIGDLASGRNRFDENARHALMYTATLYIGGTKIYSLAQKNVAENKSAHYIVLRYRDATTKEYILRPSAVFHATPLTPADIENHANYVLSLDRANHPERFNNAQVLPFKARQRFDTDGQTEA